MEVDVLLVHLRFCVRAGLGPLSVCTANLRTKILDFGGFDSSRILIIWGGILMSIGNSLEFLSQGILVGIILVGRLGGNATPSRKTIYNMRGLPTLRLWKKQPRTLNPTMNVPIISYIIISLP